MTINKAFELDVDRIAVVDSSKVTRRMIEKMIKAELPEAEVISCESGAEALQQIETGIIDLVTTSLALPDMDGMSLSKQIRENSPRRYIPIILVSGEVNQRLISRDISDDVTDYFDKSDGMKALAAFVRGYVRPDTSVTGEILYVEDSRVVALATRRMMESNGLTVTHLVTVEETIVLINNGLDSEAGLPFDLILTDVYLKGGLTGKELLHFVRKDLEMGRQQMPVLVMTGDDNRKNQSELLRMGANDLVEKPIEERLLINKLRFQLQIAKGLH
jgi:CheY-like chemotaxis protein